MKINAGRMLANVLGRVMHPRHLWRVIELQRGRTRLPRAYDDPQLRLYSAILPGGFLHYGYFDDPKTQPQDVSVNDIYRAQLRYAELILEHVVDRESPVLDVGCGMGGLIKLMLDQGLRPVALSPDRTQMRHVRSTYPQAPTIESRFEDVPCEDHANRYGTIITTESLQYLDLDISLPLVEKLLRPGGRWIVCDYFRVDRAARGSEHWDDVEKRLLRSGLRCVHHQDITSNVLPTLGYLSMWGNDIARPVLTFALEKLEAKQPGVHYALEEVIETIKSTVDRHLEAVNPRTFAATRKYMLLVMQKDA